MSEDGCDGSAEPWDGRDIGELLRLDEVSPGRFRNRLGDANPRGRAYGGQLLAQALIAASRGVPRDRPFAMQQLVFLQGAEPDRPIDFAVDALQDGKRFTSRHVRGSQSGGRIVLDAQATFAMPLPAPEHQAALDGGPGPRDVDPDALPDVERLPREWGDELWRTVGYRFWRKEAIDFRLVAPPERMRLDRAAPRLRCWMRLRHPLGDDPHLHSAAFAYLSDWWLNFPAVGGHVGELLAADRSIYVASLNHAIWQHRALRADEWMHVDSASPSAANGRALAVARVHDRSGKLVASATQECLMAPREP